jgi:replicative DNA helicase
MSAQEIIKRIQAERKDVQKELYDAEGLVRLQEVMGRYDGEYRLVDSKTIQERLLEAPPPKGHMTGINRLDELTGGFREQQVISIAAHSKHGKSQMGMFLMETLADLNPVMIPIEQTAEELISQRMERGYSIPYFLSPERLADFVTTEWIEERMVEGIAKYNSRLVVIDHLGYINNKGENYKNENLAYRIGMVMKELKNMAKKWNVVVMLLVHISQSDEGKPPQLIDIGNSSDILKESDTVILLWRKNSLKKKIRVFDSENRTLLNVAANRRFGKNGNVGLKFNTQNGRYEAEQSWVDSMEDSATREAEMDDEFEL